jgi:hypothetical protein
MYFFFYTQSEVVNSIVLFTCNISNISHNSFSVFIGQIYVIQGWQRVHFALCTRVRTRAQSASADYSRVHALTSILFCPQNCLQILAFLTIFNQNFLKFIGSSSLTMI